MSQDVDVVLFGQADQICVSVLAVLLLLSCLTTTILQAGEIWLPRLVSKIVPDRLAHESFLETTALAEWSQVGRDEMAD